jgi:hypothetical protein
MEFTDQQRQMKNQGLGQKFKQSVAVKTDGSDKLKPQSTVFQKIKIV